MGWPFSGEMGNACLCGWTSFILAIFVFQPLKIFKSGRGWVDSWGTDSSFCKRSFKENRLPATLVCSSFATRGSDGRNSCHPSEPAQNAVAAWARGSEFTAAALCWTESLKSLAPAGSGRGVGGVGGRKPGESLPGGNSVKMFHFSPSGYLPDQKRKRF